MSFLILDPVNDPLTEYYLLPRDTIGPHLGPECHAEELSRSWGQSACLAFALAVAMADSTSSTVTLRALAKGLSACLAGRRLVPPDSHLMYVGADKCARAARVRALSPAAVRRRRRSAGPPAQPRHCSYVLIRVSQITFSQFC